MLTYKEYCSSQLNEAASKNEFNIYVNDVVSRFAKINNYTLFEKPVISLSGKESGRFKFIYKINPNTETTCAEVWLNFHEPLLDILRASHVKITPNSNFAKTIEANLPNNYTLKIVSKKENANIFIDSYTIIGTNTIKAESSWDKYPSMIPGTILYHTGGYEGTYNIFYKIIQRKGSSLMLMELPSKAISGQKGFHGTEVPDTSHNNGELIKVAVRNNDFVKFTNRLNIPCIAKIWNGKPLEFDSMR